MLNIDQIHTNKYLYVWIDILGFSNILNDEKRYKELIRLLKSFRNKFENISTTTKTLTISDGVVLIFDLKSNLLSDIFLDIAKIQEKFILEEKYFLRGGMAIGTIEESEQNSELKYLISNALSKAYNIESKSVKYPIIATTQKELDELNNFFYNKLEVEQFGLKKSYSAKSQIGKEDNIYFIDFINDRRFENILKECLSKYQSSPDILEKYIWLYRYYNQKFESDKDSDLGGISL